MQSYDIFSDICKYIIQIIAFFCNFIAIFILYFPTIRYCTPEKLGVILQVIWNGLHIFRPKDNGNKQ